MNVSFYSFAKVVVNGVFRPFYRLDVVGAEHIPKEGGVLLVCNHISNYDPIVLGLTNPRPIHFMAKQELFNVPILRSIVTRLNAFPVKRGMSDRQALRTGLKILNEGNVLGLFPEGTRHKSGELGKGFAGAGFFALRTNAQVVPCAIIGPYKVFSKIRVIYGKPIDMDELRKNKASSHEVAEIIMNEIGKLLNQTF